MVKTKKQGPPTVKARKVKSDNIVKTDEQEINVSAMQTCQPMAPALVDNFSPGALILEAIRGKAEIATIERLVNLAEHMKAVQARDEYYSALAEFQSKCPEIKKTTCGPENRYKYATLNSIVSQIKELLAECGLSYHFETPKFADNLVIVACICHHKSGHSERTDIEIPMNNEDYKSRSGKAFMSAPQIVGTLISYGRRYALCNILGISTADDDNDANDNDIPKNKNQDKSGRGDQQGFKNQEPPVKNDTLEEIKILIENPAIKGLDKITAVREKIPGFDKILASGKELSEKRIKWLNDVVIKLRAMIAGTETPKTVENNETDLDRDAEAGWEDTETLDIF